MMHDPAYEALLDQYPSLRREDPGVRQRMANLYIPLFESFRLRSRIPKSEFQVLDCGCGSGLAVDLLAKQGFQAYGIDLWDVRLAQWRVRQTPRCLLANGLSMPFADSSFDVILNCGLIEHLGVHETWFPRYLVKPLPNQNEIRRAFFAECLRILRRPGLLVTDCPNGLFPIDFWHDTERQIGRWHWPTESFLPTYRELRRQLRAAGFQGPVRPMSPAGRFRFQQVGRSWWGRLLAKPVEAGFKLMVLPPLAFLAASPLNPYLIVTAETTPFPSSHPKPE